MTDRYELLRAEAAAGRVEEVIVAVPDIQGRLQGSRLSVPYFLDEIVDASESGGDGDSGGFGACVYLLASDVEMDTRPGYAIDAWRTGFGDFLLRPDPATLRTHLPWDDGTALVIADAHWPGAGGSPVAVAPATSCAHSSTASPSAG